MTQQKKRTATQSALTQNFTIKKTRFDKPDTGLKLKKQVSVEKEVRKLVELKEKQQEHPLFETSEGLSKEEAEKQAAIKILRAFDLNMEYGPNVGLSRQERYVNTQK
eukprot:Colp12_sorted_trinity150504_noHs@16030